MPRRGRSVKRLNSDFGIFDIHATEGFLRILLEGLAAPELDECIVKDRSPVVGEQRLVIE